MKHTKRVFVCECIWEVLVVRNRIREFRREMVRISQLAAVAKCHSLGVDNRHLFLTVFEDGKSKINCWQSSFILRRLPLAYRPSPSALCSPDLLV